MRRKPQGTTMPIGVGNAFYKQCLPDLEQSINCSPNPRTGLITKAYSQKMNYKGGIVPVVLCVIALATIASAHSAHDHRPERPTPPRTVRQKCKTFGWLCHNAYQRVDKGGVTRKCNKCIKYCGAVKEERDVAYCKWAIDSCSDFRMCKNWGWRCYLAYENGYDRVTLRNNCSLCSHFCGKANIARDVGYCKWACAQSGLKGKCNHLPRFD